MPIQDGTIPSSSFERAVRDLPFCLSGSIYLPCEAFTAVGMPFSTSASSAPLSAPEPTAMVVLVDPSHRWLFHMIENWFFPLVTRCFWMAHWANSTKQWQLWKQRRQGEVKSQLLEATALRTVLTSEGHGLYGRMFTAVTYGLLPVGCNYRLINTTTPSFMSCP